MMDLKEMKGEKTQVNSNLRRLAEEALEASSYDEDDLSGISPEDKQKLIHELRVHQIEQKMKTKSSDGFRVSSKRQGIAIRTCMTLLRSAILRSVKRDCYGGQFYGRHLAGNGAIFPDGTPFSRFILQEDQDIFYLLRKQLMDAIKPQSCRLRMVKKDETVFCANLECNVIEEEDGCTSQIRAAVSDRTEQKDLEDQLRQAQKMEAIGTLAGGIAHNFNNILAVMIGFTELSLDDAEKGTPLADNLKEVLIAGQRAKIMVQQILTFSRKAPRKVALVWLEALVRDSAKMLRETIPADIGIGVTMNSAAASCVMGDEVQIHQIIMNLCINAAHAMETKGGKITIGVDAVTLGNGQAFNLSNLPPGKYVKLSVSDTGSGISPENIDRIFEPYLLPRSRARGPGWGLPLLKGL